MPVFYARFRTLFSWLAMALILRIAAGCSLTTTEVEPELPTGRVSDGNTLVYRSNGVPVVAHNDSSLGTFLTSLFGDNRPVAGNLIGSNELIIRARDSQNEAVGGQTRHELHLALPDFQGVGTYFIASPYSYYQETIPTKSRNNQTPPQTFYPTTAATVEVTEWNPTTRQLRGTFGCTVADTTTGQLVVLTDGHFDVIVN
ncbi:hypothetical protein I2I05_11310 [Hymenobacter sp. BT683]|uniref:Uncharacterized protein n=1 Tax=Hymenobacter jeongseonensis TaxID=2791027 RepID=A0ABS0II04_9BACT|nr:hypothetical protein [Hymenobacter jeongseonensis]MBF9237982.1 hypothetical protein [Hymenobacter jeongseonensis]